MGSQDQCYWDTMTYEIFATSRLVIPKQFEQKRSGTGLTLQYKVMRCFVFQPTLPWPCNTVLSSVHRSGAFQLQRGCGRTP